MKVIASETPKANRAINLRYGIHPFSLGTLLIAQEDRGLCWLGLNCTADRLKNDWPKATLIHDPQDTAKAARLITNLWPKKDFSFKGFDDLNLILYGTPFQIKVWQQLMKIPLGKTMTYAQVAQKIKHPKAVRAVGSACGKNPISLLVPCHRVVSTNKANIHYGWGADLKLALLKSEQALPQNSA